MPTIAHRRAVRQRIDNAATKAHTKLVERALRVEGKAVTKATAGIDEPAAWEKAARGAVSDTLWITTMVSLWLSDQMLDLWDAQQKVLGTDYAMDTATRKRITRYATDHGRSIADVRRDRMSRIVADVVEGLESGKARDRFSPSRKFRSAMRSKMREEYTTVAKKAAGQIARTETLQASETVRYESARTSSTRSKLRIRKIWFTVGDSRVREDHQKVNGKSRFVDHRGWGGKPGRFTVGGESLRYPRDPNGSPAQVYNCRCFLEMRRVRAKT